MMFYRAIKLTWHELHNVSNHRKLDCLVNYLIVITTTKTAKLWITYIFFREIHRSPEDSPHKGPAMRKAFPCHGVSMEYAANHKEALQRRKINVYIFTSSFKFSNIYQWNPFLYYATGFPVTVIIAMFVHYVVSLVAHLLKKPNCQRKTPMRDISEQTNKQVWKIFLS